jgi:hypothetical protein
LRSRIEQRVAGHEGRLHVVVERVEGLAGDAGALDDRLRRRLVIADLGHDLGGRDDDAGALGALDLLAAQLVAVTRQRRPDRLPADVQDLIEQLLIHLEGGHPRIV